MAKIFLLTISGLLPFWCLRPGVVDIPLVTRGLTEMGDRMAVSRCQKVLFCLVVNLLRFFNLISRLFIPNLRKRGILTFFWIVNEEEDWEKAISIGCQGIMTDRPSALNKYLKGKGLYFESELMPETKPAKDKK